MPPLAIHHNPQWKTRFTQEEANLRQTLGNQTIAIHHIGSTSIPDILAKPIIDILIEIKSLDQLDQSSPAMESLGYEVMGEFGIETRRYFRKSNPQGIRTHHIHAFAIGSPHLTRHLAFRDYLLAHPLQAQKYSSLKANLITNPNITLKTYIAGKNAFIKQTESKALTWAHSNP